MIIINSIFNYSQAEKYSAYLKNKYNLDSADISLISYKNSYTKPATKGFMSSGSAAVGFPATAIFKVKGKIVTVLDGKNISDDYQLKDVGLMSAKYFSKLLGLNVTFVQFGNTYIGDVNDTSLSDLIRGNDLGLITDGNIANLLQRMGLSSKENTMTLYVNLRPNESVDYATKILNDKAMQYINQTTLVRFAVWLYQSDKELPIKNNGVHYPGPALYTYGNYYVDQLDNIKSYLMYVDPYGNNRDPNFDKVGNFYVDNRGLWYRAR